MGGAKEEISEKNEAGIGCFIQHDQNFNCKVFTSII